MFLKQIEFSLNENPVFNKIGAHARKAMSKIGFMKQFEVDKEIISENARNQYVYLVQCGIVSLQSSFKKSDLKISEIDPKLKFLLKDLKEGFMLEIATKGLIKRLW